jgi:hypothetical protein
MLFRKKNSKKHADLVEDQPGLVIFIAGFTLSILAGFAFRSFFASERIYDEVLLAAQRIHPSIKADIKSAELKLSDHGLPAWNIEISGITLDSSETCWGKPRLEIDKVVLPLSWKRWFQEQKPFDVFQINKAELRFADKLNKQCFNEVAAEPLKSNLKSNQGVVFLQKTVAEENSNLQHRDFLELKIKKISVQSPQLSGSVVELENLSLIEKSVEPKVFVLKASTPLFRDIHDFDYSTKADLQVEYTDFPEKKIQAHMIGQFREGHFAIHFLNRVEEGLYNCELELKHLPLSKVFSVLHKYGFLENMSPKQAWLSLKGGSQGLLRENEPISFEVKDFHLEGELGSLKTGLIEITNAQKAQFKPFLMQALDLDFEKLLELFQSKQPVPTLGSFGQFSGRVEIKKTDEFRFFGKHKNLELIFSNKGQRQIQKVNEMSLDLQRKKDNVTLALNRIELEDGQFDGEISVKADTAKSKYHLNLFAGLIDLNPKVQSLISQGPKMGSLKGSLDIYVEDQQLKKTSGRIHADSLIIETLRFEDPEFVIKSEKDQFLLSLKAKSFFLPKEFIQKTFLVNAFPKSWFEGESAYFQGLQSEFLFKDFNELRWRNAKAQVVGAKESIQTEGHYDQSSLRGSLSVISDGSRNNWKIEGTRNEPQISESVR